MKTYKSKIALAYFGTLALAAIIATGILCLLSGCTATRPANAQLKYQVLVENIQYQHKHINYFENSDSVGIFLAREFAESRGNVTFYVNTVRRPAHAKNSKH